MIPELAPLFQGEFERYREVLVLRDDPRPGLTGRELVSEPQLRRHMAAFKPEYRDCDPRGLVSIWSKYYFLRLIPPVVAASLVLDRRLPLDFDRVRVVVGDDGLPQAFKLPHAGTRWSPPPGDPHERFAELVDGNLRPFIEGLSGQIRIAPRVLWSNAGSYFEWIVSVLARLPLPEARLADAQAFLEMRHLPGGARNPLHQPVRYLTRDGGERLRQRRQCCIRYLLPGLRLCENCPHIDRPPPGYREPGVAVPAID